MSVLLARRDPTVKAAVVLCLSLLLVLVIDPVTPLLFGAVAAVAAIGFGGVPPATLARALWPLALVGLGLVWTNGVFARVGPDAALALSWGPFRVSEQGLLFGFGIALRGLAIGTLSVVFVLTTDPSRLVVSLIRNARVPFRVGYPMLAAYRFLPFFAEEYEQIALAQRVRGIHPGSSPAARLRAALARPLPLFAEAVRRSARIAIAMDARGFAAARERTYLREAPIVPADLGFALASLAVAAGILVASAVLGWLRFWDGRFAA